MLSFLPHDMLNETLCYLTATEFKTLYLSVDHCTQNELKKCTIKCKIIISDDLVKWFEDQNIKFELKKTILTDSLYSVKTLLNGKIHSFEDKPAYIKKYDSLECKMWYKNGLLHRDNNLPAVVDFFGENRWYINGKLNYIQKYNS